MNLRLVVVLLLMAIAANCSNKPTKIYQKGNSVHLDMSKEDEKLYNLAIGNSAVASSKIKSLDLEFDVPNHVDPNSCFRVIDQEGDQLLDKGIRMPGLASYRLINAEYQELNLEVQQNSTGYLNSIRWAAELRRQLSADPLYNGLSCSLPKQRSLPARPRARCTSRYECESDGAAICFTRFLGSEGCSLAASEVAIPGILSSPACSAAAASLAGEKYEMGDAVVDAIHGAVDDVSEHIIDEATKGEEWDWLSIFLGGSMKLLNYGSKLNGARQCTTGFVNRHYGPTERWLRQVEFLKSEPYQLRSQCEAKLKSVKEQDLQTRNYQAFLDEKSKELKLKKANFLQAASKENEIEFCSLQ